MEGVWRGPLRQPFGLPAPPKGELRTGGGYGPYLSPWERWHGGAVTERAAPSNYPKGGKKGKLGTKVSVQSGRYPFKAPKCPEKHLKRSKRGRKTVYYTAKILQTVFDVRVERTF